MPRSTSALLQAMAIFFGVCSGVAFGNVTLSTPFSIAALISSCYITSSATMFSFTTLSKC